MSIITCKHCGKEFKRKPSQIRLAREHFCSTNCQHKASRSGKQKDCFVCGKHIYRQKRFLIKSLTGKFFCSKNCSVKWWNTEFVGEKHPNWKTGEFSYRTVLKKTNLKQICRQCGKIDKRILVAHHLDKNRQNNKSNNLIWLCHNCHHLIHHYGKSCL